MVLKKSALIVAASLLAMSSAQAVLSNATANLSVNIVVSTSNVSTACTLVSGSVIGAVSTLAPFVNASYTSGSTSDITNYSTLRVQCNGNDLVPFTVSAGAGNNSNGTTRRASANAGVDLINYKLQAYNSMAMSYIAWDDAMSPVFGGTALTGTTSIYSGATTSSSNMGFQLVVPAGQTVPAATYTDVVLLTATF